MRDAPQPEFRRPTREDRLRQRERPRRGAAMHQSWSSLLFAHWRVEPDRIQRTLPLGLYVDTFDGSAYVGVVPFFMRKVRPWWSPCLPWFSNFLELNVRTYVHDAAGTPGVWFYSLDCDQPLAVWGARKFYHLPYRHAAMSAPQTAEATSYHSRVKRTDLRCDVHYELGRETREAVAGSLDFFFVERYVLFAAARDGRLFIGQVYHRPYPLVATTVADWRSNLLAPHDFCIDESQPQLLHGSRGVDVEVFSLQSAET
jgi:uncharacterized protein YqjF (DUF2071 family)